MKPEHRHFAEPDLLEAALDSGARALRAEIAACAECARRLQQLEGFVARVRGALVDEPAPALAERVLAATTREDLGWRGDLHVAWRFARSRLRASPLLRAAAAILAIHLAALPVLAWIVLRAPPRDGAINVTIELPRRPVFPMDEREPERAPSIDEPEPEPRLLESEFPASGPAEAARAAEVLALQAFEAPRPGAQAPSDALARLLWTRARALHGEASVAELDAELGAVRERESECALALELALDRLVSTGRAPQQLERTLLALLERDELGGLALLALERAERCGVLGEQQARRLREKASAARGFRGPLRRGEGSPVDRLWLTALAEALGDRPLDADGVLAAWLALER